MAVYLFTKNSALLHEIQSHLTHQVIRASSDSAIRKICVGVMRDPHAVLIIDESYHTQGLFPLLEFILSCNLSGPRILIPARRGLQSSYASDGTTAILYRPFTGEQFSRCLQSLLPLSTLREYVREELIQTPQTGHGEGMENLIGTSDAIRDIKEMIRTIHNRYRAIHITGETGTGKEVVADAIIAQNPGSTVIEKVNCSTIPVSLADSFLFGARRGAYTDSKEDRPGCIERAHGGILFLDEIEDLPYEVQGKLLRVIESGEYLPVGSDHILNSRFQLISASNIDIESLTRQHSFRTDLYHRITPLIIRIPPLRERKEDIPLLVDHYLKRERDTRVFTEETLDRLMHYTWPGNVRQLYNVLEQIRLFSPTSAPLSLEALPPSQIFRIQKPSEPLDTPTESAYVSER